LRITRFPSLSEPQFNGCVAAFADSLAGELNSAVAALRRLESQGKGAAFAFEMELDRRRYGVAIVLERWAAFHQSFGPHLPFPRAWPIVESAPARVEAAEKVLESLNRLIDGSDRYSSAVVEACQAAFQSIGGMFDPERKAAESNAKLGPMLPEEYTAARQIFLEDLAAR
jgi:hypothetical protein